VHEIHGGPFRCQRGKRLRDRAVQRVVQIVVADPVFEEITEHVQGPGALRRSSHEAEKLFYDARPFGCEVQVRNEKAVRHTRFRLLRRAR
jgi:hypothetical protein